MDFNLLVLTSFEVTTKDSQEPNYNTWTLDYGLDSIMDSQ